MHCQSRGKTGLRSLQALLLALLLVSGMAGCSFSSSSQNKEAEATLSPQIKPPLIHEAGKLYLGVNLGMAPFAAQAADGYKGFDIDLGNAIAKRLGLKPVFVAITPDTMAQALEDNKIDLALSAPTDDTGLVVAQLYYQDAPALFARSEEASAVAATPRLPKTALQEGSAAQAQLVSSMSSTEASASLQFYPEVSAAIKACEDKKTVAVAGDYAVLRYAQLKGAKIKFVRALASDSLDRGVAIRADNVELMRQVKPLLTDLHDTGAISAIMRVWIGADKLAAPGE